MTRKQIDAARERRLWLSQIVGPAIMAAATMMTIPEVRQTASEKYSKVKTIIKNRFKK